MATKAAAKTKQATTAGGPALLRVMASKHERPVRALAFSPDGQVLLSGSDDGAVRLWETATGARIDTRTDHPWGVVAIAVSPDGKLAASTSVGLKAPVMGQTKAFLWNLITRRVTELAVNGALSSSNPAFSPDSRIVAVKAGPVRLFNTWSGEVVTEIPTVARAYTI